MYSASVELSAISVCSLFDQCIGTPANTMITPVRDKHESCRCVNSYAMPYITAVLEIVLVCFFKLRLSETLPARRARTSSILRAARSCLFGS
jgi:hypothetical protein